LLNKNNYLIGFRNGVYDLKNNIFRKGIPEDYISKQIPYDYAVFDPADQLVVQIEQFYEKLFPDREVREYIKDVSAELFVGGNYRKHLYFWSGNGDNGKSIYQLFIEKMLGPEYSIKLPTSVLVGKRGQSGSANPELIRIGNGVRHATVQEPDKSESVNVGFMKELTGGNDSIFTRDLFQKGKDIKEMDITCKITICANDLPKAENADPAFWNRVRVILFESKFSDSPPLTYEEQLEKKIFPKDKTFHEKIPLLVKPLAWYLLERRKSHLKFIEPAKVLNASIRYRNKNDTFGTFIADKVRNTNNNIKLYVKQLTNTFYDWFKETRPSKRNPDKDEFVEYCTRVWGEPEEGAWLGKCIKDDVVVE
jgi:phage/plasmid-associated DNA primase